MKKVLFIFLLAMTQVSCQKVETEKKIKDEQRFLKICSLDSIEYDILFEYDELNKMVEGIYLTVIKPSEEDFKKILANAQQGELGSIEKNYLLIPWRKSPIDSKFDRSLINYSPIPDETGNVLQELEKVISKKGNYYTYYYDKTLPSFARNSGLYVVDMSKRQIKIYQTYF